MPKYAIPIIRTITACFLTAFLAVGTALTANASQLIPAECNGRKAPISHDGSHTNLVWHKIDVWGQTEQPKQKVNVCIELYLSSQPYISYEGSTVSRDDRWWHFEKKISSLYIVWPAKAYYE